MSICLDPSAECGGGIGDGAPSGTAPSPTDPGSGGTFLNELGTFIGVTSTGISNIVRGINTPAPVTIPRTTNIPSSSLQRLGTSSNTNSILLWVVIGLAIVLGLKFLRK